MHDVRQDLRDLANRARELHVKECQLTLTSVELVGELDAWNAAVNLGMSSEQFAVHIGLTANVYWKRVQAARVLRHHPRTRTMLAAGETQVTHLALLAPKITQANATLLLAGIKGKSRREVEGLLSRVTCDGRLLDTEEEVELRLKLTKSQLAALDRAREVLSHSGHVPTLPEIMMKALADLLEKRDPLRRAERAQARREKAEAEAAPVNAAVSSPGKAQSVSVAETMGKAPSSVKGSWAARAHTPAAVRHAVALRDQGQCTWRFPDGTRCPERAMLELDHVGVMHCRGGPSSVENLALRCRHHNQHAAEHELGRVYMANARAARSEKRSHE